MAFAINAVFKKNEKMSIISSFRKNFKQIKKPKIIFKYYIDGYDYDLNSELNSEYNFIQNSYYKNKYNNYVILNESCVDITDAFYFNEKGILHNEIGPAVHLSGDDWSLQEEDIHKYYLNNIKYTIFEWNQYTNHILCKNCKTYCNQQCF